MKISIHWNQFALLGFLFFFCASNASAIQSGLQPDKGPGLRHRITEGWQFPDEWQGGSGPDLATPVALAKQGEGSAIPIGGGDWGEVYLHSGAYEYSTRDIEFWSSGLSFVFSRTFRSDVAYHGPVGRKWDHFFNRRIEGWGPGFSLIADGKITPISNDGSIGAFECGNLITEEEGHTVRVYGCTDATGAFDTFDVYYKSGITEHYQDVGFQPVFRLAWISDANGNQIHCHYDSSADRYPTSIEDSEGRVSQLEYYPNGHLKSITDPIGRIVLYRYDDQGDLIEVRKHSPSIGTTLGNPLASPPVVTKYKYDSGLLKKIIRPEDSDSGNSPVLILRYDRSVDPPRVRAAILDGNRTRFQYGENGENDLLVSVTDANGNLVDYEMKAEATVFSSITYHRNRGINPLDGNSSRKVLLGSTPSGEYYSKQIEGEGQRELSLYDVFNSDPLARNNLLELRYESGDAGIADLVWRMEYGPHYKPTVLVPPEAFPDGIVPVDAEGHLDLSDPLVQKYATWMEYDLRGNLIKTISPAISTTGDHFILGTPQPVIVEIERNGFGLPKKITQKQGENGLVVVQNDFTYWPRSSFTGQDSSFLEASGDFGGFSATTKISGKSGLIPGEVTQETPIEVGYRYDSLGNPIEYWDGNGELTQFTYNLHGQIRSATNAIGVRRTFFYDKNGNMVKIKAPRKDSSGVSMAKFPESLTEMEYDRLGRKISHKRWVDEDQVLVSRFYFDPNGNLILRANPSTLADPIDLSSVESWVYDELDQAYTHSIGGTTSQFDDLAGAGHWNLGLESFQDSLDRATEYYHYNSTGQVVEHLDARGSSTHYAYHPFGWLEEVTDRVGTSFAVASFDSRGRPLEVFASDGEREYYRIRRRIDEVGRIVQVNREFFHHDEYGQKQSLGGDQIEQWAYDAKGDVVIYVDPQGNETSCIRDFSGNLLWKQDPLGNVWFHAYDGNGQTLRTESREMDPDNPQDPIIETEQFQYNSIGLLASRTDHLQNQAAYQYNSLGLVDTVIGPLGNITRYEYDGVGRNTYIAEELRDGGTGQGAYLGEVETFQLWHPNGMIRYLIDDNGSITEYRYDARGLNSKIIFHDGTAIEKWRDANGNVILHKDQNGTEISHGYDEENRLITKEWVVLASDVSAVVKKEHFTLDGLGRISSSYGSIDDGSSRQNEYFFEYDSLDHLREQTMELASGQIQLGTVRREFDAANNPTSLQYPGVNSDVYYNYATGADRLESLAIGGADQIVADFQYYGLRRKEQVRFFADDGVSQTTYSTSYRYDEVLRVASITSMAQGGFDNGNQPILDLSYQYDAANRNKVQLLGTQAKGDVYAHDSLGRLVQADIGVPEASLEETDPPRESRIQWTLDGVQNRLEEVRDGVSKEYSADPAGRNRYMEIDGQVIEYDANGNLINDGQLFFVYDFLNRLVEIKEAISGSTLFFYSYDPFGRRIATLNLVEGRTLYHVWLGNRLLQDVTVNAQYEASPVWRYIYGVQKIQEPLIGEKLDSSGNVIEQEFYLTGKMGSVRAAVDADGIRNEFQYSPFGEVTAAQSVPTDHTVFGYTGHIFDPIPGLHYMRNRFYSSEMGRFLTPDPSGYVDGPNLYAYVRNNPVDGVDPLGLESAFGRFVDNVKTNGSHVAQAGAVVITVGAYLAVGGAIIGSAPMIAAGLATLKFGMFLLSAFWKWGLLAFFGVTGWQTMVEIMDPDLPPEGGASTGAAREGRLQPGVINIQADTKTRTESQAWGATPGKPKGGRPSSGGANPSKRRTTGVASNGDGTPQSPKNGGSSGGGDQPKPAGGSTSGGESGSNAGSGTGGETGKGSSTSGKGSTGKGSSSGGTGSQSGANSSGSSGSSGNRQSKTPPTGSPSPPTPGASGDTPDSGSSGGVGGSSGSGSQGQSDSSPNPGGVNGPGSEGGPLSPPKPYPDESHQDFYDRLETWQSQGFFKRLWEYLDGDDATQNSKAFGDPSGPHGGPE